MFRDRREAGQRLAEQLLAYRNDSDVVVVGLPRGGVPVAQEVAVMLGVPMDVIVIRKRGVPFQPELAMGAIGEDGARYVDEDLVRRTGVSAVEVEAVEQRERSELEWRSHRFRTGRPGVSLDGRVVIVVDDGVATGSTARAACHGARAPGARRVILAVPVAHRIGRSGWTTPPTSTSPLKHIRASGRSGCSTATSLRRPMTRSSSACVGLPNSAARRCRRDRDRCHRKAMMFSSTELSSNGSCTFRRKRSDSWC